MFALRLSSQRAIALSASFPRCTSRIWSGWHSVQQTQPLHLHSRQRSKSHDSPEQSPYRRGLILPNPAAAPTSHSVAVQGGNSIATVLIVAVVGASGSILYLLHPFNSRSRDIDANEPTSPFSPHFVDSNFIMAGQLQPGRPSNLTAQEEACLQEMWKVLGTLFHFEKAALLSPPTNSNTVSPVSADAAAEEKKKKTSRGFFGRRKAEKESKDTDSSNGSTAANISSLDGGNDKFGETQAAKDALAGHSPEELRDTLWMMCKHDDPDALVLRFLRARKWNVQAAVVMFISAMNWRMNEMHLDDDIMYNGEAAAVRDAADHPDATTRKNAADYLTALRWGKGYTHGVDNEGRPMTFIRVRLHRGGEQSEASLERYTVHAIETGRLMLKDNVDTATIIFDMTNFTLANMDYSPVKFMIKCFEANFPESLGAILVHKAPWVFQGIWAIIKGWLDPVVMNKIHFTKSFEDMLAYVPRENIPTELGGEEQFVYEYLEPVEGENKLMEDTATRDKIRLERDEIVRRYEDVTVEWISAARNSQADEANKSATVKEIKATRSDLARQLRDNYWKLDPYIRAKTYLDREGVINPGGVIVPYPERQQKQDGTTTTTAAAPQVAPADDKVSAVNVGMNGGLNAQPVVNGIH